MLERNLPIEKLTVGDIVSPEGKYITSKGYYFTMGTGFRVKRINQKSVSLAPLNNNGNDCGNKWVEGDIIRISRRVIEQCYLDQKEVEPLFARDNDRLPKDCILTKKNISTFLGGLPGTTKPQNPIWPKG